MQTRALLQSQCELTYKELLDSIQDVSEHQAWAVNTLKPDEYMHAEGSIISTVMHVAGAKYLFGSAGFRNLEMTWRDTIDILERVWPNWEAVKEILHDSHRYFLQTWSDWDDFEAIVKTHSGRDWPAWKVITVSAYHDTYHAGQIQLLKAQLEPTTVPPPDEAHLWRKYCADSPSW